jgi:hypothetical protein
LGAGHSTGTILRREPIRVGPGLPVEPLPTVYARRAASCRFVRSVLEETFGVGALTTTPRGDCASSRDEDQTPTTNQSVRSILLL